MSSGGEFNPHRHKVWIVHVDVSYTTFAIAESQHEAEATAEANSSQDLETADTFGRARELTKPYPEDGHISPWGPSEWEGKQLTVNQAIELIQNPPGGRIVYDTQTVLMPWADSPPPIRVQV